jgi:DsbC/DsbD-like thiol-disulfide interchange protein
VKLAPDWKTYWRMPGEAGIPPQFDWSASANVAMVDVAYPLPSRFSDESGETIGYHNEVLFPLTVTPKMPGQPVALKLKMFFAVCRDVCIPAMAEQSLDLSSAPPNSMVEMWRARVPVVRKDGPVKTATLHEMGSKPFLVLAIDGNPADIFVESETAAYFGRPRIDREFVLPISNIKDAGALRGKPLKVTLAIGSQGIEQSFTVP